MRLFQFGFNVLGYMEAGFQWLCAHRERFPVSSNSDTLRLRQYFVLAPLKSKGKFMSSSAARHGVCLHPIGAVSRLCLLKSSTRRRST